jgi:hypothetical protein
MGTVATCAAACAASTYATAGEATSAGHATAWATAGAAGAWSDGVTGSTPGANDRDMVATEATSAPHTEQEKRPGASGESHSGQTTVFVAINHLRWNPDPPGPGLQAATPIRDRPIPRTVVHRCPERPGLGPDSDVLEG